MPPPHRLPTDAIGGGGGRAVGRGGAVDDLSMGGAEISYSAHHAQDMSANGTLRHHHDHAHKATRRSAANQERRRHDKGVAFMMNLARNEQQRQMGLQQSLDIKGLNDRQADNEGLGAGGECTGAGNERAGDGNAIAGAGIACAGAYTIAGMACAHELRHWTPPAPSPNNLGDAADGAAPANSGGDASARQTMDTNKGAVGVAMQFLGMIDYLHDMHQRKVVSDSDFAQWSNWAREHVTSVCRM